MCDQRHVFFTQFVCIDLGRKDDRSVESPQQSDDNSPASASRNVSRAMQYKHDSRVHVFTKD